MDADALDQVEWAVSEARMELERASAILDDGKSADDARRRNWSGRRSRWRGDLVAVLARLRDAEDALKQNRGAAT